MSSYARQGRASGLYVGSRADLGKTCQSLGIMQIPLLTFLNMFSRYSFKLSLESSNIAKCFWKFISVAFMSLKTSHKCNGLLLFSLYFNSV